MTRRLARELPTHRSVTSTHPSGARDAERVQADRNRAPHPTRSLRDPAVRLKKPATGDYRPDGRPRGKTRHQQAARPVTEDATTQSIDELLETHRFTEPS